MHKDLYILISKQAWNCITKSLNPNFLVYDRLFLPLYPDFIFNLCSISWSLSFFKRLSQFFQSVKQSF